MALGVGILIITHGGIGTELMKTALNTIGDRPLLIEALAVPQGGDVDRIDARAEALRNKLDSGAGVLVLTDMYGSTPSNIANRLRQHPKVAVVTGVNLPMLMRILNYPKLGIAELVNKATSGGHDGIMLCANHGEAAP
ncbi:MAG: PTS sugar transporter subunit IIA [Thiotrichales bacterium]